jgi:hypothetical protein
MTVASLSLMLVMYASYWREHNKKRIGLAATLWRHPVSNGFRVFAQSLQANVIVVARLDNYCFLPDAFPGLVNRENRAVGSVTLTTLHPLSAEVGTDFVDKR